jgi:hypothetical protein
VNCTPDRKGKRKIEEGIERRKKREIIPFSLFLFP